MQNKKVLITTSSNIEGAEIIEYIQPVTAHIVIGMNLFKDIFSGLRDIFGGHSSAYQNTLSKINQEAIQILQVKAKEKGCNCVIDLKIDNDEISAQGKSMLMVTAIGMAVRLNNHRLSDKNQITESISGDLLNNIVQKRKYLSSTDSEDLGRKERFWNCIIENKFSEFGDTLIDYFDRFSYYKDDKYKHRITEYFNTLEEQDSRRILYSRLADTKLDEITTNFIQKLITELKLVDFNLFIEMLEQVTREQGLKFVKIMSGEKKAYSKSDISTLKQLTELLEEKYPITAEVTTRAKRFSRNVEEVWKCQCGHQNTMDFNSCGKCHCDRRGVMTKDFVFEEILNILFKRIEALEEVFLGKSSI